jgi:GxxExxY protein
VLAFQDSPRSTTPAGGGRASSCPLRVLRSRSQAEDEESAIRESPFASFGAIRDGRLRELYTGMANSIELLHGVVTDGILGCFYAVGRAMGYGFLESVFQASMFIELTERGLKVRPNAQLPVRYKGRVVGDFKADLIVEDKVIVEVKAMRAIEPSAEAQLMNYLRASDIEVGLILNFGPRLEFRRRVMENARKAGTSPTTPTPLTTDRTEP